MTFNEWLNEIEGFGLRVERIHDDLVVNRDIEWRDVKEWLEAAYDAGCSHGKISASELSDSYWTRRMREGRFPPLKS
jgi:hypothetical protein